MQYGRNRASGVVLVGMLEGPGATLACPVLGHGAAPGADTLLPEPFPQLVRAAASPRPSGGVRRGRGPSGDEVERPRDPRGVGGDGPDLPQGPTSAVLAADSVPQFVPTQC